MLKRNLLPIATAALALSACGGDSGPSKDAFIEEADAICAEASDRSEETARDEFSNQEDPRPDEVLAAVKKLIPIQRESIADVRALEMPEDDEAEINDLLDQADAALDDAEEEVDTPAEAVAVVQSSDTPEDPFYEVNRAMADYGFEECSE